MGAVGGLLGTNGGQGGTGFSTQAGTNAGQLNTAYNGSQNAMGNQAALLTALQGQNGLGNQSQVYNQLQNVATGNGPNPAQAMLNQATGQNVQNQAALMAGQRGASGNVGLMARQNAQQGANIQQQAAGQGATMQANQALNAIGQAGQMASTMAGQQIGQTNQNVANAQNEQNILQGANSAQNTNQTAMATGAQQGQQATIGGLMNGLSGGAAQGLMGSSGGAAAGMASGGQVPNYDIGGSVGPMSMFGQALSGPSNYSSFQGTAGSEGSEALQKGMSSFASKKPPSKTSNGLKTFNSQYSAGPAQTMDASNADPSMPGAAHGGEVKAKVSPGELILTPEEARMVAAGRAKATQVGKKVPGKAKVAGDSTDNDFVDANLPIGGVVVKRTKALSDNPDKTSAEFVRAHLNKRAK
jgi:hypothetical protein